MGGERDGHKPRETDHGPLILRREGVAAKKKKEKKSINSQAGGENRTSSRAGAKLQLGK